MYRPDVATQPNGADLHSIFQEVPESEITPTTPPTAVTQPQPFGPYFVIGSPFRAKLSPIAAEGVPLIVSGTVLAIDTKRAVPFAVMDLWQASGINKEGKGSSYDYYEENERRPYKEEINLHGKSKHYDYRSRILCDEHGHYEFETVTPAPYQDDMFGWRCSHIHCYINSPGYKPLVTHLYFRDQIVTPGGFVDKFVESSGGMEDLLLDLEEKRIMKSNGEEFIYMQAKFDFVIGPQ